MTYDYILALDPSGSFNEGKGTTGWSLFDCKEKRVIGAGSIHATACADINEYWEEHIRLIRNKRIGFKNLLVVMEDYIVYADKAESHINSHMETSKLIGILQHYCYRIGLPYIMQTASIVKARWANNILLHKGYITLSKRRYYAGLIEIDRHCIDSIRHAVHAATFRNEVK